jgi:hypothetical protein
MNRAAKAAPVAVATVAGKAVAADTEVEAAAVEVTVVEAEVVVPAEAMAVVADTTKTVIVNRGIDRYINLFLKKCALHFFSFLQRC